MRTIGDFIQKLLATLTLTLTLTLTPLFIVGGTIGVLTLLIFVVAFTASKAAVRVLRSKEEK